MGLIRVFGYENAVDVGGFRMQINNSFFLDESMQGSLSFPVKLPATDATKEFFQWLEKPGSLFWDYLEATLPASYEEDGSTLFRGNIIIQKASEKNYEFSFAIGLTEFDKAKDKSLRDIPMGGVVQVVDFQKIKYTYTSGSFSLISFALGAVSDLYPYGNISVGYNTSVNQTLLDLKSAIDSWQLAEAAAGRGYRAHSDARIQITVSGNSIEASLNYPGCGVKLVFTIGYASGNFNLDYNNSGKAFSDSSWKAHMLNTLSSDEKVIFVPMLNKKSGTQDFTVADGWVENEDIQHNKWNFDDGEFNVDIVSNGGGYYNFQSLITPFPRAKYILSKIVKHISYQLEDGIFTDEESNNLFLWSSYVANMNKDRVGGDYGNVLEAYFFYYSGHYDMQRVVPNRTVNEFLNALRAALGCTFYPDHLTRKIKAIANHDILASPDFDDWTQYLIRESQQLTYHQNPTGIKYDMNWDASDEAKGEICPDISGKLIYLEVDEYTDLPAPPITEADFLAGSGDLSTLAFYHTGILIYVRALNAFYAPTFVSEPYESGSPSSNVFNYFTGWKKFADGVFSKSIGDGTTSIKFPFDILMNDKIASRLFPVAFAKMPYLKMAVNFRNSFLPEAHKTRATNETDFGIRFFYYRGMAADTDGNPYPLAGWDSNQPDGTPLNPSVNKHDLSIDGEKGLLNTRHKLSNRLRLYGRPVEFVMNLPKEIISQPTLWRKKQINGINYIIKTIDLQMPHKGNCVVQAVKIPNLMAQY